MNPALAIQAILAVVAAAPKVQALAISAKDFVTQMFNAGLIKKEVQDATHAYVDSICVMAEEGITPPHWQVEQD